MGVNRYFFRKAASRHVSEIVFTYRESLLHVWEHGLTCSGPDHRVIMSQRESPGQNGFQASCPAIVRKKYRFCAAEMSENCCRKDRKDGGKFKKITSMAPDSATAAKLGWDLIPGREYISSKCNKTWGDQKAPSTARKAVGKSGVGQTRARKPRPRTTAARVLQQLGPNGLNQRPARALEGDDFTSPEPA